VTPRYFSQRIRNALLLTAGVVVIVFCIFSALPAEPSRAMLGQHTDSLSSRLIKHDFGLDQPVYIRFLIYINDLLPLSVYNRKVKESPVYLDPGKYRKAYKLFYFGADKAIVFKAPYLRRSYHNKESVYELLKSRFRDSAILATGAIIIAVMFGVFFGIIGALKRNSWAGKMISALALAGTSLPVFFIAILFAWLFGFLLHRYTGLNMTGAFYSIDPFEGEYINWKNLILPALVLSLRPMALMVQQTRTLFTGVMSQQYILTARAKGVRKSIIIFYHAWLNTTAPLVLLSGRWLGSLLAGLVFVEFIFGWNGVGKLAADAIGRNDLPVLMGIVLFVSVIYILLKTLTELLYSTLDPRVDMKIKI
jgi:peptide/nickel transport system permease protein